MYALWVTDYLITHELPRYLRLRYAERIKMLVTSVKVINKERAWSTLVDIEAVRAGARTRVCVVYNWSLRMHYVLTFAKIKFAATMRSRRTE